MEVFGQTNFKHPFKKKFDDDTIVIGLVNVKYYTDFGVAFTLGVARGINDSPGTPAWQVLLGASPAKRAIEVTAPSEEEEFFLEEEFMEEEGVPIEEEEAPIESADRDNDGIPDIYDYCPDEPEDYDGVEDFDGCPE